MSKKYFDYGQFSRNAPQWLQNGYQTFKLVKYETKKHATIRLGKLRVGLLNVMLHIRGLQKYKKRWGNSVFNDWKGVFVKVVLAEYEKFLC